MGGVDYGNVPASAVWKLSGGKTVHEKLTKNLRNRIQQVAQPTSSELSCRADCDNKCCRGKYRSVTTPVTYSANR